MRFREFKGWVRVRLRVNTRATVRFGCCGRREFLKTVLMLLWKEGGGLVRI